MKIEDGRYKTMPKWGMTVRMVTIRDGIVTIDGCVHSFSVDSFFSVNKII